MKIIQRRSIAGYDNLGDPCGAWTSQGFNQGTNQLRMAMADHRERYRFGFGVQHFLICSGQVSDTALRMLLNPATSNPQAIILAYKATSENHGESAPPSVYVYIVFPNPFFINRSMEPEDTARLA